MAESVVAIYQSWAVRKDLNIIGYLKDSIIFFIAGILMYFGIKIVSSFADLESWIMIGVKVIIGAIIYLSIVVLWFVRVKKVNILRLIKL